MGGSCPLDRVASSRRRAARRRNGERKGLAPGEEDSYSVISLARQRGICPDMQNRLVPRYPLLCSIPRDACPIGLARRLRRAFFRLGFFRESPDGRSDRFPGCRSRAGRPPASRGDHAQVVAAGVVQAADDPALFVDGDDQPVGGRLGQEHARQLGQLRLQPGMPVEEVGVGLARGRQGHPEGTLAVALEVVRQARQVVDEHLVLASFSPFSQ